MKLDPKALAEWYEEEGLPKGDPDLRPGVQHVDAGMIEHYVIDTDELPRESAEAFAAYIEREWYDYADGGDETLTNKDVIDAALEFWCGGRRK